MMELYVDLDYVDNGYTDTVDLYVEPVYVDYNYTNDMVENG